MSEAAEINLEHLDRLTDSTGLIQHAIYSLPRRESGYTIDDNARALRLCVQRWSRKPEPRMLERITHYLSLLEFSRRPGGGFHNRALAEVLASELPDDYRMLARELIDAVLPTLAELRSLRAQAYTILAYGRLWRVREKDIEPLENVARLAAENLVECYHRSRRPDWHWFESRMTYANAVMPHALFVAAQRWPEGSFRDVAEDSLAFLDRETTVEGLFWPVGNNGWYARGETKASYDQQPVEAATMAEAALDAFHSCSDEKYLDLFRRAHGWFHGRNSLGQSLVDVRTGGCCDGLQAGGVNRNQGAESTLAYLAAEVKHFGAARSNAEDQQAPVVEPC
ncbi:MAG: hypothetical protein HZB38_07065 [Planctomycetes bacterium]|nr:hypothetical protein [Planctomycetota bacterium]